MPYRPSFALNLSHQATVTDTIYVDVQLQPEAADHLRYSLTSLDWPSDDQGQIKGLDNSTNDITLVPVLVVNSTISPTLAGEYAIAASAVIPTDASQGFSLWAPLTPVSTAGSIYAFGARLAFTPAEADAGINLSNGKIVWVVSAKLDTCDPATSSTCTVNSSIAQYAEDSIRVSGLSVTQSRDVEVGLFGTSAPATSTTQTDEDTVMFTLMSAGLAGNYLYYVNPDLDQIKANFEDTSASSPYSATWGIDPAVMAVATATFDHRDEALATTTQTNTVTFLDTHYADCTVNTTAQITPTLATAYQETSGHIDLSSPLVTKTNADATVESSNPITFNVPLSSIVDYTLRRSQLTSYGCGSDGNGGVTWQPLTEAQALIEMNDRYPDQAEQRWMSMVQQLFLLMYYGRSNTLLVNGHTTAQVADTNTVDAFTAFSTSSATSLPDTCARPISWTRCTSIWTPAACWKAFGSGPGRT